MAKKTVKKTTRSKKTASSPRGTGLATQESRLRRLDRDLTKLVNQRAKLAREIGQIKEAACLPALGVGEEERALAEAVRHSEGPLSDRSVRAIFRELTSGSRSLLRGLRIALLGPLYSYSHLAAIHRFGQSVEFLPVGTIAAVFEEVNRGHADYGLVPIENSTDGRIADTLDMFTRLPVRICGEVELAIHHTLLGRCSRKDIKEVYSRPQALSQCRNWLAKHLPSARPIEVTSTSTAAELAKEKPGAAAIASLQAGVHYGLDILAEYIEDNPGNTTRFSVIADQSAPRTGNDKTAAMFELENRPGVLADALNVFKRNRVNLTWIESFPIPATKRAYFFFIEMEGHETDARVRRATNLLEKRALRLEILGSYPVSPVVE